MMAGKREFVLIDDQKLVYETALAKSREAQSDTKQVVIVDGGPGTGKSVVAVNLVAALNNEGRNVRYVSKNRAPRQVIEHTLAGTLRRSIITNLFGGSGSFVDTEANVFDTLIVDEAHRLNEKSGLYANQGEHQVSEIIRAARSAVFFI
jgi:KaiC/GvpD/RAD55 family RecA-like ATPase